MIMQLRTNISGRVGLWLILFTIFGGAYKTAFGTISTSYISFVWGGWILIIYIYHSYYVRLNFLYRISRSYYLYAFFISVLLIVSLIQFSFLGIGDMLNIDLQLKRVMQAIVSFTFFAITADYIINKLTVRDLFLGIIYFLLFITLLCVIQLSNDSFRIWYLNLTAIDGYWYEWAQKSNRAIGLKAMSIWDTSVSYSFLLFIAFAAYFQLKNKNILLYLFVALVFLLIVMSGRTGLLFFIVFSCLLSIRYKIYGFMFTYAITSVICIFFIMLVSESETVLRVINFAFELIMNIINGKIETNSTDDLINNHLFIPHLDNIFWGDNIYIGDGDEVISKIGRSSDSAFVINYVSNGVIGFFITSILAIINGKMIFSYFNIHNKSVFYFFVLLVCFFLSFGLYIKVLVYVSATLLKAMIFTTICLNHIFKNKIIVRKTYEK
ncbi:hypothetical protein ACSHE7_004896 [Escherichia coli]